MSHAEVVWALRRTPWDPATLYRALVRLTEVGIARIATRAGGKVRYELAVDGTGPRAPHAHFACVACGSVACLPMNGVVWPADFPGPWRDAVLNAAVHLEGCCPTCGDHHSPVGKPKANTES
jgi:Fur family transcriptional regulator, ferric uptake regulator